jgi:hypothetical protein
MTVFGVYEPLSDPGAGFAPLMCFNGVDTNGTTQRFINVRVGAIAGMVRFQVEAATTATTNTATTVASGTVGVTDAWVFALRVRPSESTLFDFWLNGVQLGTLFAGSTALEQTGELGWNGGIVQATGVYPGGLLEANIGDLIGYSDYLDDADMLAVSNYLLAKWGI